MNCVEYMFIVHPYCFTTLRVLLCLAKASALFYDNTIPMNPIGHMLSLLCNVISSFDEFNQDVSKNHVMNSNRFEIRSF